MWRLINLTDSSGSAIWRVIRVLTTWCAAHESTHSETCSEATDASQPSEDAQVKWECTLGPTCWRTNAGAEVAPSSNFKDQNSRLIWSDSQSGTVCGSCGFFSFLFRMLSTKWSRAYCTRSTREWSRMLLSLGLSVLLFTPHLHYSQLCNSDRRHV